jgi:hypothetical protein
MNLMFYNVTLVSNDLERHSSRILKGRGGKFIRQRGRKIGNRSKLHESATDFTAIQVI